jgi:hypothetical protein
MAYRRQKISQMPPKGANLDATDLLEISEVSGSGYITKSITGQEIIDAASGGAFVPYTGATANVDLGTFHLDAGKGTFSHNGSTDTLTANHTSGSGIGLLITKGGSNEGLKVNKTSGSGNAATIIGTLEATTLVKTGGLSTQFLMADGTTSLGGGGGITVGTTAVTSGTIGRIFFEGTGNVVQQSASLFWDNTNARLGVGATPASTVRLDVRAQGALSTDIAFRVRNSADTGTLLTSLGSAQIIFGTSTTTPDGQILVRHDFGSAQPILTLRNGQFGNLIFQVRDERNAGALSTGSIRINGIINGGETVTTKRFDLGGHGLGASYGDSASNAVWENNQGNVGDGQGTSVISVSSNFYINRQTVKVFKFIPNVGNFGVNVMTLGTSATNTIAIANGVAPTTSPANAIQLYSNDITAGNAAPHFRTENGAIVKVYQETTGVGASTLATGLGTPLTDTDTFDGYTLKQVVKALRNLGILA